MREGAKGVLHLRRPRRLVLLMMLALALAVAVPVALATFTDVPPSNPFYNDINAIQGAGVTQGCGGGNFCPTDNITRQAEAAFVHRAAPRAAFGFSGGPGSTIPTSGFADLASATIDVGGIPGGTQFVLLNAVVTTRIEDATGCPCVTGYFIANAADSEVSDSNFNTNSSVGDTKAKLNNNWGFDTGAITAVVAVPTGSTQTFKVRAQVVGGTYAVTGYADLTAITAPFGSTGADTLGAQAGSVAKIQLHHPIQFPLASKP